MGYHHPAIEEADRAAMERLEASAVQPALDELRRIKQHLVSPWVVAVLASALADLSNGMGHKERDTARRCLDDLVDDMKGFHRDRC